MSPNIIKCTRISALGLAFCGAIAVAVCCFSEHKIECFLENNFVSHMHTSRTSHLNKMMCYTCTFNLIRFNYIKSIVSVLFFSFLNIRPKQIIQSSSLIFIKRNVPSLREKLNSAVNFAYFTYRQHSLVWNTFIWLHTFHSICMNN